MILVAPDVRIEALDYPRRSQASQVFIGEAQASDVHLGVVPAQRRCRLPRLPRRAEHLERRPWLLQNSHLGLPHLLAEPTGVVVRVVDDVLRGVHRR